jgi:hypothetical protein
MDVNVGSGGNIVVIFIRAVLGLNFRRDIDSCE